MNIMDGSTYGLTVQFGRMNPSDSQTINTSETQQNQGPNSFLSILNLLDTNADGQIDAQELKFGAGFMINSMLQAKDLNGDQLLSPEEAGISSGAATQLDSGSDGSLSAKELITAADKVIDGLVSVLDTNGDGALSPQELAIFEFLFSGNTSFLAGLKGSEPVAAEPTPEVAPVASSEAAVAAQSTTATQTATSGPTSTQQTQKIVNLKV